MLSALGRDTGRLPCGRGAKTPPRHATRSTLMNIAQSAWFITLDSQPAWHNFRHLVCFCIL